MDFTGSMYIKQKNDVIKAERRLLKELGFCVHVKYPHKIIIIILSLMLEQSQNTELVQLSWNFMNDSLRSDVFMKYTPDQIGCACIWLSARIKKICLPENPPWYELLDCSKEQCVAISTTVLNTYCLPRPNVHKLERAINAAKETYEHKKLFNEKHKKGLKEIKKLDSGNNFSPSVEIVKSKDSPAAKPKVSPSNQTTDKLSKLAGNGSSDHQKNGGKRRHQSPRRRYSPVSPPRRKHYKKKRSSSDSEGGTVKHKRRGHKRRVTSSSDTGSSTSGDEAVREEARKRRHEEKKSLQLKEKIKQLAKGKSKKEKLLRDSVNKHKVR